MLAFMADAAMPAASAVVVQVANVRNSRGRVHVALCPRDKFLGHACAIEGSAPAHPGVTTVTLEGVPPGDYAAQAFHDENDNRKVDQGIFGIPKEGVGFSRDARIAFGPPKWADAVITHGDSRQTLHLALRYFMGPGGPDAWARSEHPH